MNTIILRSNHSKILHVKT